MQNPPAGFPDFDKIFGAPFFAASKGNAVSKPQVYTNPTTEIDWDNFASNFTGPPKFVPASQGKSFLLFFVLLIQLLLCILTDQCIYVIIMF